MLFGMKKETSLLKSLVASPIPQLEKQAKRLLLLFLILIAALSSNVWAKRAGPAPVAPVVAHGVTYVATNASGVEGKIEARNEQTGQKLWDAVIYTVKLKPDLEQDVQWVFISQLSIHDNTLLVINEAGEHFTFDLATRKVESVK